MIDFHTQTEKLKTRIRALEASLIACERVVNDHTSDREEVKEAEQDIERTENEIADLQKQLLELSLKSLKTEAVK